MRSTSRTWAFPDNSESNLFGIAREYRRSLEEDAGISLEAFLAPFPREHQAQLLEILVPIDMEVRRQRGEAVEWDDYVLHFPVLRDQRFQRKVQRESQGNGTEWPVALSGRAAAPDAPTLALLRPASPFPSPPGYQVLERLARGGMGVVYRARDLVSGKIVALKMMAADEMDGQRFTRLRDEIDAVRRLQHPRIVQILDVGEHVGQPYLVLEYVDGGSLHDLLREGPLPVTEAVRIVAELARIMHYVHSQGVVHRDLKPANVLQTKQGKLKLTDFGIAKLVSDGRKRTGTGVLLGTPAYMAPEQIRGQRQLGPATDIYAMGVILYELLTGRVPFNGEAILEVLEQTVNQAPPSPGRLVDNVPSVVEVICLKCLEKEPERRYASAEALADDLERYLTKRPICARGVSPAERLALWGRRNPLPAVLALLLMFLVCTTSLGSFVAALRFRSLAHREANAYREAEQARRLERQQRSTAEKSLRVATSRQARLTLEHALSLCEKGEIDAGLLWLGRSLALAEESASGDLVRVIRHNLADWKGELSPCLHSFREKVPLHSAIISPDGEEIVTAGLWAQRYSVTTGQAMGPALMHTILSAPSRIWAIDIDATGNYLATASAEGTARLWDLRTMSLACPPLQHAIPKSYWSTGNVWTCTFNADGTKLITGCSDRKLRVFEIPSGRLLATLVGHKDDVLSVAAHPHDASVLSGGRDGLALLWNLEEPERPAQRILLSDYWVETVAFSESGQQLAIGTGLRVYVERHPATELRGDPFPVPDIVKALKFTRSDEDLLVGMRGGAVRSWNVGSQRPVGQTFWMGASVSAIDIAKDNSTFAVSCIDGTAKLWRSPVQRAQRQPALVSAEQQFHQIALRLSEDGNEVVMLGGHGPIHVCRDAEVRELAGKDRLALAMDLSPDGALVAVSYQNQATAIGIHPMSVNLLDMRSGEEILPPLHHRRAVMSIAFDPTGAHLLTGSDDHLVRCWNADSGELEGKWEHGAPVKVIAFDRSGRQWVSAGGRKVALWQWGAEAPSWECWHAREIGAVEFDRCGEFLYVGTRDGEVTTWDLKTQQITGVPIQHSDAIRSLAIDPQNQLLAVASADGSVRYWDRTTHVAIGPTMQHGTAVHSVRFHPEKASLITGTLSGKICFWHLPPPPDDHSQAQLQAELERLTGKNLDTNGFIRVTAPDHDLASSSAQE